MLLHSHSDVVHLLMFFQSLLFFEYTTRPCITREAQVGQALHTQYVQRGVGKQENRTKKK